MNNTSIKTLYVHGSANDKSMEDKIVTYHPIGKPSSLRKVSIKRLYR